MMPTSVSRFMFSAFLLLLSDFRSPLDWNPQTGGGCFGLRVVCICGNQSGEELESPRCKCNLGPSATLCQLCMQGLRQGGGGWDLLTLQAFFFCKSELVIWTESWILAEHGRAFSFFLLFYPNDQRGPFPASLPSEAWTARRLSRPRSGSSAGMWGWTHNDQYIFCLPFIMHFWRETLHPQNLLIHFSVIGFSVSTAEWFINSIVYSAFQLKHCLQEKLRRNRKNKDMSMEVKLSSNYYIQKILAVRQSFRVKK